MQRMNGINTGNIRCKEGCGQEDSGGYMSEQREGLQQGNAGPLSKAAAGQSVEFTHSGAVGHSDLVGVKHCKGKVLLQSSKVSAKHQRWFGAKPSETP